jgi:transcriptional regulator with XRE-family HTH domain
MHEQVLIEARKMIAGFIRNRRIELKMSQDELAERTHLGIATIKRFEAGKFWINLKTLLIICNALSMYFFLEEKDSEKELAEMMKYRFTHPQKPSRN